MRLHLLVAVMLLSNVTGQLLAFVPSVWQERSSFVFAGCLFAAFVFALLALTCSRTFLHS